MRNFLSGVVVGLLIWSGYTLLGKPITLPNLDVKTKTEIKLGWMGPLTGDAASYGESIKRGVELARKELGLDVEIIYEDSKCDGKEAVTAINKLINVNKVAAIIGEVCSGATLAAAPVAEAAKAVLISPSSTSPKVSDAGDYIFRVIPSDALQGDFGAKLVYDKGYRKLGVLYSNEEYGLGFNNVLKESFEKLGGQLVASEAFERGTADIRTQVTKLESAGPDAIYIISNSPDSAVAALKQIKEQGLEAALFGSEGLKSDDILTGAASAAEGLFLTTVSSGSLRFMENHKKEYNADPGPFAAQGYDAFQALALTIKTGADTSEEIKDKLSGLEFDGASGKIKFDAKGDVSGNYDVFVVKDGKFAAE